MEKVEVRRAALFEVANLSGWDLQNVANGHEAKFIRKIVKEVLCELKHTVLDVAVHPVGIDSRVKHIKSLLSVGSDDVRMIGIYDLGGIGKTTIAKAVYNHIFLQFEGSCFLANVREVSGQLIGLVQLQEQLLFELLGIKNLKIGNVDRGINLMKERLHSKKVLIVLDDVDDLIQLRTLAGNHGWFGPGSRIIITTRDEHLLKSLKVDERYMVEELNHEESLQLFSWHAFRETNPLESYAELANGIVRYAGGLPLALEVLGSHLFEEDMEVWESAFDLLRQIPHEKIQKKLQISFDALGNGQFKDIFLDIACFFIGMDKGCAITILNACDLCAKYGISVLIRRCLLKIDEQNKLTMHDLLRDMGREIVRQESPKELGKRSRLWFHEDVLNVLGKNKGTEKVEGVSLTGLPMLNMIRWSNKAFAGMQKLRLLQINHVHLSGNFEHLFEELRWLCWHHCPLKYLPSNFHLEKLAALDMQFSRFKTLRIDGKFKSLKILNLSNSKSLTKSPIFCALSMLEELRLESCTSLMELHESIELLDKLVHLNLKDCMNLRYLPGSICKLKSVKHLNLIGCAKLEELPELLGHMESLTELLADGTTIKQLPVSIGLLKNLRTLSLKGCNRQLTTKSWFSLISSWVLPRKNPDSIRLLPSSVSGLCSLTKLVLSDCNLSEGNFPANIWSLSSLRTLDLSRNNFDSLPYGFSHLSKLESLQLSNCTSLQSISDLPPNLLELYAYNCASLEKISDLSKLKTLIMKLSSDPRFEFGHSLSNCNHDGTGEPHCFEGARLIPLDKLNNICAQLSPLDRLNNFQNPLQNFRRNYFVGNNFYTGDLSPNFSYKITGSSTISVEVPVVQREDDYVSGFNVGVVYYRIGDEESCSMKSDDYPYLIITDKINGIDLTYTPTFFGIPQSCVDYVWTSNIGVEESFGYRIKGGEQFEFCFVLPSPFKVKKCAVDLIVCYDRGEFSCFHGLSTYWSSSHFLLNKYE